MSQFEHSRFRIFNPAQHPLVHDFASMYYSNPVMPGVGTIEDAVNYLAAAIYPKYINTVANKAALPVTANPNDYYIVNDDGDGKRAGYVWQVIDGVSGFHKRYDMDWSADGILQEAINRTFYMYFQKYGFSDTDANGDPLTGDSAGQHLYGGELANTNLILHATSGDALGAHTGVIFADDNFQPFTDATFSLGAATKRWLSAIAKSLVARADGGDTLTLTAGLIESSTGALSFGDDSLTTTGNITAAQFISGTLNITGSTITSSAGAISFGDDNISTTGTSTAAQFISGTLNITGSTITSSAGAISFGDDNISTTGNVTGAQIISGTLNITGPIITSSTGAISFDNENLSTTGSITGGTINGGAANFTSTVNLSALTASRLLALDGSKNVISPTSEEVRTTAGAQRSFNGLENPSSFTPSYDPATRVFTLTYGVNAYVWCQGTRYTKTGSDVMAAHANSTGKYYAYFDNSGTLIVSATPYDLELHATVAIWYYNATSASYILFDERHPAISGMSNATHKYLHATRGTQKVSGFVVSGFTLNTAGTANTNYSVASGVIADEDLLSSATSVATTDNKGLLQRVGASGDWTHTADSPKGYFTNGTNIQYNQFTGGAWQLTPITVNNRWVNYYVVISPALSVHPTAIVAGQQVYTTLNDAISEDPALDIQGLTNVSDEFVYVARITYRRVGGSSPDNVRVASVQAIVSTSQASVTGLSPSNHNALTNLTTGDPHTQYAFLAGRLGGQTLYGGTSAAETLALFGSTAGGAVTIGDLLRPAADGTIDLGATSFQWKDIYSSGEHKGLRLQNYILSGLPSPTVAQTGRAAWVTDKGKPYFCTGAAWVAAGGANKFTQDISFNGTETSKAVDVSSVISDARTAIWQLKDAADSYNCVTVIIKTTQTTVTIESYPALEAGTYRLVGVE